ncbi:outer membrane protein assembly factor [Geomonas sp. RF6]|uniref:BamA/TamA family outer membrane protein n=1 Tax=Geomonas sp. RF6 TaxID=2897342 RepID=UPI001E64141B|nr:BamA/TamA family outer membrane protein [Geomonas sp. RF6]UFS72396.1 outer membrane protein assembly factor [Geomonas sp. RF6]
MRRLCLLLAIILCTSLQGCTSYRPAKSFPIPVSKGDEVKVVTVPLPVIASSPNEGITYGALTAFLLHNEKDEVSTLVAPQLNYNQNFGVTASLYGAYYPNSYRSFEGNLSKSTRINEDYELRVRDKSFLDGKLDLNAFVYAFSDGSARFFGFQSTSSKDNESNYADKELGFTLSAGYSLSDKWQVVVGQRFRKVDIEPGAIHNIPFIGDVDYPGGDIPGVDGFNTHAQMLSLVYNTLDSQTMPTTGIRLRGSIEMSLKGLGSSETYNHYEAEAKGYYPLDDARYISVARLAYSQTLGNTVPFLERSILGGENTLRGYGRNRFIDSSYLLLNLEERIRLFRWEIFGVRADWELAPFIDLGSVMENLAEATPGSFEFNPGVGFRAVIRPNIVGRVDFGIGKEGPSVFVGLGYPF